MKLILACSSFLFISKALSQASVLVGSGSYISGGNNAYIVFAGNLQVDGTVNTSNSSTWYFNGSTQQRITCLTGTGCTSIYNSATYPVTVGNLTQNNANGIAIEVNTTVNGTHTFTSGATEIKEGIYWLTKTSGAYSGNNTSTRFFITTGHGLLRQSSITAGRLFPIGTAAAATNYTPVTIAYTGTADNFGVRVMDNVFYSYDPANGDPLTGTTNTRFVKKTWIVRKDVRTVGDSFNPTLQWNAVNEDPAFTPRRATDVTVARNHDGFWIPNTQGPASGAGPFTLAGTVTYDNAGYEYFPVAATAINTILAVTGLKLTGAITGKNALLQWTTLTEQNAAYFELQRSTDGVNFLTVHTTNAMGNTNTASRYSYTDDKFPAVPKLYYRVKQVDNSGAFSLSNVLMLSPGDSRSLFIIYPNPAKDDIMVHATGAAGNFAVSLKDVSGKTVSSSSVTLNGTESFTVPCAGNASGLYILNIVNKATGKSYSYKVIVTH